MLGNADSSISNYPDQYDGYLYSIMHLPAVIYNLGSASWSSNTKLRACYFNVASSLQWKFRKPISYSLHEIAKVLGPEIAQQDLLPLFEQFLKDLDNVKIGVITNMHDFLMTLPPDAREPYLPVFKEIIEESGKTWRIRKIVAGHMKSFCSMYKPHQVSQFIFPLAIKLARDSVSNVRAKAFECVKF
jgi:serine/threonine-protein phosphatase 4 regulatory subunit 1